jgi:hypothetical protein
MTTFTQGQSVTTTQASVVVDAGLPIGRHRFRLVVFDTAGNASAPQEAVVQVFSPVVGPTPVPVPTPIPTPVPRPVGIEQRTEPASEPTAPRKTRSKT